MYLIGFLFILSIITLLAMIMAFVVGARQSNSDKKFKKEITSLKKEIKAMKDSEKRHSDLTNKYLKILCERGNINFEELNNEALKEADNNIINISTAKHTSSSKT